MQVERELQRFGRFDLILVPGLLDTMEDPAAGRMVSCLGISLGVSTLAAGRG
jgi:hypothetical protein